MMGRLKSDQGRPFYEFHLGDAVPEDHPLQKLDRIVRFLDAAPHTVLGREKFVDQRRIDSPRRRSP